MSVVQCRRHGFLSLGIYTGVQIANSATEGVSLFNGIANFWVGFRIIYITPACLSLLQEKKSIKQIGLA